MTASKLTWFDAGKCFIGGRWVRPRSGGSLPIEDPSRGIEIGEIARGTAADIDAAVEAAERALHGPWGRLTAAERGRLLAKLAELVNTRVDELARIEALDVGKPLKQGRADALALARYMEFYAGAADKVMGETIPYLGGYTVYTLREPHGVTGHIVPWNYPMQIAGRTVGAALAMGNACVLEAGGGSLPHLARARRSGAGSGFSGRRAQRRSRPRRGGGRRARRPSRRAATFPSPARSRSGRWSRRRRRAMSPR